MINQYARPFGGKPMDDISASVLSQWRLRALTRDDKDVRHKAARLSMAMQDFQRALLERGWSSAEATDASARIMAAANVMLERDLAEGK